MMTRMIKIFICALATALVSSATYAQNTSAGLAPALSGYTINATGTSSSITLTGIGTTIVVWNIGTVEAFYVVGPTATTSGNSLPAGAAITLNVPFGTTVAAITASSTTTLRITQGIGTPFPAWSGTSTGGGGTQDVNVKNWAGVALGAPSAYGTSPGAVTVPGVNAFVTNTVTVTGTLAVTQGTSPWVVSGTVTANIGTTGGLALDTSVGTTNTNLGAPGAVACASDTSSCSLNQLMQRLAQRLTTINTTLGTPMQTTGGTVGLVAGSAIIGNVRIDQTTPGTTNGVQTLAGSVVAATLSAETTKVIGTVNQGTSPWVTTANVGTDPTQAPVAPATAIATKSTLIAAQATTAAVNPTNGQQGALSSDTNNNLLVSSGGAPNLLTAQVSVATSDTAVVAARALRRSVTITNVTGTQDVYCSNTTATTANGQIIPGVKGASWNTSTTAAVRCIAVTGAQTVSVAEVY